MLELDCEENWAPKNWCFWTVVLGKTLESPLACKEIQPVHSEDQPWDFFGRNDAEAESPVLWSPHAKSWLVGKDSDAGRDWGQAEKGTTEDEMAGWHHWLNGCEFGWTPGDGDGQGGLVCCDSWGRRVGHDWLNWTEVNVTFSVHPMVSFPCCVHKSVFYIWLYSFSANRFITTIFFNIPYFWVNIQYLFFCFWLTSFCVIGSRFIHVTTTDSNSFF